MVYWGTSFSGGDVIYAAVIDKHIKAAIAQAPSVSGETRSLAFKNRIPGLFDDRAHQSQQAASEAGSPASHIPLNKRRQAQHPCSSPVCTRTNPIAGFPTAAGSGRTM